MIIKWNYKYLWVVRCCRPLTSCTDNSHRWLRNIGVNHPLEQACWGGGGWNDISYSPKYQISDIKVPPFHTMFDWLLYNLIYSRHNTSSDSLIILGHLPFKVIIWIIATRESTDFNIIHSLMLINIAVSTILVNYNSGFGGALRAFQFDCFSWSTDIFSCIGFPNREHDDAVTRWDQNNTRNERLGMTIMR